MLGIIAVMLANAPVPPAIAEPTESAALHRAPDGLFYVTGLVNGVPVRFLVDTGASTIVLTQEDAARAHLTPDADGYRERAETVGGDTAMAWVVIPDLHVGSVHARALPAAVVRSGLGVSLLGQNWLSQLASLTIAGDRLEFR